MGSYVIIELAYSSTALMRSQDSAKELEEKMRLAEQEARDLEMKKRLAEEEREKTRKENLSQKQKTEAMVGIGIWGLVILKQVLAAVHVCT